VARRPRRSCAWRPGGTLEETGGNWRDSSSPTTQFKDEDGIIPRRAKSRPMIRFSLAAAWMVMWAWYASHGGGSGSAREAKPLDARTRGQFHSFLPPFTAHLIASL
jgi:hypothetical protein